MGEKEHLSLVVCGHVDAGKFFESSGEEEITKTKLFAR